MNVFEIWRENGRQVPFRVRNIRWSHSRAVTVVRVSDVKEQPDGKIYGHAFVPDDWYHGPWSARGEQARCQPGEKYLRCAGCYQWEWVVDEATVLRLKKA